MMESVRATFMVVHYRSALKELLDELRATLYLFFVPM